MEDNAAEVTIVHVKEEGGANKAQDIAPFSIAARRTFSGSNKYEQRGEQPLSSRSYTRTLATVSSEKIGDAPRSFDAISQGSIPGISSVSGFPSLPTDNRRISDSAARIAQYYNTTIGDVPVGSTRQRFGCSQEYRPAYVAVPLTLLCLLARVLATQFEEISFASLSFQECLLVCLCSLCVIAALTHSLLNEQRAWKSFPVLATAAFQNLEDTLSLVITDNKTTNNSLKKEVQYLVELVMLYIMEQKTPYLDEANDHTTRLLVALRPQLQATMHTRLLDEMASVRRLILDMRVCPSPLSAQYVPVIYGLYIIVAACAVTSSYPFIWLAYCNIVGMTFLLGWLMALFLGLASIHSSSARARFCGPLALPQYHDMDLLTAFYVNMIKKPERGVALM